MKRFIKATVRVENQTNTHYYRSFEIIDKLPEIGDNVSGWTVKTIEPIQIDWENRGDEFVEHDFYKVVSTDDMEPNDRERDIEEFFAVKKY